MSLFGAGDMVVAITSTLFEYLEVGRIYTIRGVCLKNPGGPGFHLEEVTVARPPRPYCNCFDPSCFRPVRKTSIEQFRELVAPKPKISEPAQ